MPALALRQSLQKHHSPGIGMETRADPGTRTENIQLPGPTIPLLGISSHTYRTTQQNLMKGDAQLGPVTPLLGRKSREVPCIPIFFGIFQFIVIHTVKGFGIVNKAENDILLELSSFFDDPADVRF